MGLQCYEKVYLVKFPYIQEFAHAMHVTHCVDLLGHQQGDSGKSQYAQTQIQLALNILWSIAIQSWSVLDDS